MKISVVVPVYGCKKAIPSLYERLTTTFKEITKNYEIILVNDDCPQNSWEEIEKLCIKDKHVIGLNLSRNFGQMKAILAGLDYSTGEYVVVMDCDLQDRPEEIINLYKKINEGYDVVFARREKRQDNFIKKFISKIFYKIYSYATDLPYDETLCNFSIAKRIVIDNYCKMRENDRAFVMYIKWMGFKETTIDVKHDKRYEGKSSYNLKKRMKMAREILLSQSDKIIKLITKIGFLITLLSTIYIVYLILNYFINKNVISGWTSIMAIQCFIGGILMTFIGIIGLYIGNIFMQIKSRPLYIIKNKLNYKEEKNDTI